MWKPFHVRFEQLITRMTDHQRIFEAELHISDGQMLNWLYDGQGGLADLYSALPTKLSSQLIADRRERAETQAGKCTITLLAMELKFITP
jgi:hypothetical protein